MGNILTTEELAAESDQLSATPSSENTVVSAASAEVQPPAKKLKSLKFFYIGLAWAFGYPTTAMLIGYAVSVTSGSPTVA